MHNSFEFNVIIFRVVSHVRFLDSRKFLLSTTRSLAREKKTDKNSAPLRGGSHVGTFEKAQDRAKLRIYLLKYVWIFIRCRRVAPSLHTSFRFISVMIEMIRVMHRARQQGVTGVYVYVRRARKNSAPRKRAVVSRWRSNETTGSSGIKNRIRRAGERRRRKRYGERDRGKTTKRARVQRIPREMKMRARRMKKD